MNAGRAVINVVVGDLHLLRCATGNGDQGSIGEPRLVVELDRGQLPAAAGDLDQSSVTAPTGVDIFPEIIVEADTLCIQGWVLWMVMIEIRERDTTRCMAYDILSDPN